MKKIFFSLVGLVALAVTAFVIFMSFGGRSVLTGYSLRCDSDTYMLIEETGSPIRYGFSKAVGTDVEKLTDGDSILIISDVVNESYPGSTRAYFILKLSDGKMDDIPEDTLISLQELGWYKKEE